MSAEKPQRPTQVIQQEYQNLALKTGNLQYQIVENSKDLALMNATMRELNFEFIASRAAEEKAKADAAKQPSAPAQETA